MRRTGGPNRAAFVILAVLFCCPLAPRAAALSEILMLDGATAGTRLVAVGQRGVILVSHDDGREWHSAVVPTRVLLTAVHMHDENIGWAVGHDAVILRTDDGGRHWKIVHSAPEEDRPLLDVWFRDADNGFAVGAYGFFLVTRDGGRSWQSRAISEDDFHLNALVADDAGRLFLAAESGVVYRSDDLGETWRELQSPYAGSWFGALALDGGELLLLGLRGRLFRSADGGGDWSRVPTGTVASLTGAARLDSGAIVVAGLGGTLLMSRDGGRSVSALPWPSRQGIAAVVAIPGGRALLLGEFGVRILEPRAARAALPGTPDDAARGARRPPPGTARAAAENGQRLPVL